ncbi:MAG: flagellar hook-length control protein FliK [Saccharospirillaceae bacterium]|nr:flagellar hook-length control protein FliK [Saccharospirillaceae bacterium]MCD8531035.1 flagellar hook-length control protein FliK [Saccharospirillaceae bacterium]
MDALSGRQAQSTAAPSTESQRQAATQNFNARVISSIATDDGYRLTLEGQDNSSGNSKTLQVNSQHPLPRNTRLTLQLSEDADGQIRLSVTDIKLPPPISPLPETSASLLKLAAEALLANLKSNDKTTAQIPLPPATAHTPHNSGSSQTGQQTGQPAAPLPALISQFLASRLPLLNSAATPTASPGNKRPGGVDSAGIYTNPAKSLSGNHSLSLTTSTARSDSTVSTSAQARPTGSAAHSLRPLTGTASALQQLLQQPQLPASVRMPIQHWLNNLPQMPQLQHPTVLRESVLNSGLMYENKVMSLLHNALSAPLDNKSAASTTTTGVTASASGVSTDNDSRSVFRSLWARTALSKTVAQLQTLNTAQPTDSRISSAAPPTVLASAPTDALTAALQATREQLEKAAEAPNPAVSNSLLQQIEHLLHSDSKAALGKALLAWLQIIAQNRSKDGPIAAPRELPLSLPAALRDNLPEGFRLLHSTLAQLEVDQALRLQNGNDSNLNIPLFYRDDQQPKEIRLQLQKEDTSANDRDPKKTIRWRLKLHFELQHLGPLDVELEMTLPQIAATFWSEQQDTLAQLQHSLQPLRSRLQQLGADVSELRARHGRLPESTRNSIRHSLVDVHS